MRLIDKKQYGGVTATFVPRGFIDVAALTSDQASSSSSQKESKSMLEEQMSKYGDWAGKILPSEINAIQSGIMSAADLEDSPDMAGLSKAQRYALLQSKYIQQMNTGLMNYKNLEKAKDHIIQSGAAQEIALTSEGYVFVRRQGGINLIPYTKFDPTKDIPITNAELTNLRANDPKFGFNDKVTASLMGATSMKEIRDIITQTTQRLATQSGSSEMFINPLSEDNPNILGILRDINITKEDLKTMDLGTLIKRKVSDKSNAQALSHAVNAVIAQLTQQQRALLAIRAKEMGQEADPRVLIMEYMASMASGEHSESLDIVNTFSSGNAELRAQRSEARQAQKKAQEEKEKAAKNPLGEQKTSAALRFALGMTEKKRMEITNGAKGKFVVEASVGRITKDDNPIGMTTLDGVANSDFSGSLDWDNVTVGGIKVDRYKRNHVLVDGEIRKAALPIDQKAAANGVIKPDIDACQRMDYAWQKLRQMGISEQTMSQAQTPEQRSQLAQTINKVFQEMRLPLMFIGIDERGMPIANITNYVEFAMLMGHVDSNVLPSGGKWESELTRVPDEDQKDVIAKFKEQYEKGAYTPPYKYEWWHPAGWWNNPADLFECTVFIPMNTDFNTVISTTGASYQPKVPEALEIERRTNQVNNSQSYSQSDLPSKISY